MTAAKISCMRRFFLRGSTSALTCYSAARAAEAVCVVHEPVPTKVSEWVVRNEGPGLADVFPPEVMRD